MNWDGVRLRRRYARPSPCPTLASNRCSILFSNSLLSPRKVESMKRVLALLLALLLPALSLAQALEIEISGGSAAALPITVIPFEYLGMSVAPDRSEERRVGQEWSVRVDLGGRRTIKKKTKSNTDDARQEK